MKLFSEKVEPTFTSSNLNILGVKNFKEIFIDVFEFEINGKKFVAEKVSDHKGLPVVNIPIVLRGNEYTAPFVLRRGEIEVLFNENNATFVRPVLEEVQELIEQHTDGEKEKVYSFIKTTVEESANKLSSDIESKTKHIEGLVNEKIINLTTNTIPNIFLKSMRDSSNANLIDLREQLESIGAEVKDVKAEKENIYNDLKDLAEGTLHLSENVDKNINKALSRVGNIRATLETSIESAVDNLNKKIEDVEANIERYYSEKIASITSEVHEITEQNKESLIELIESSKQALLQEISSIKDNVPNIVIENADGKQEVDIKGIKTELEKIIGTKFTTEIAALRRLIELSSGGGSVAKQFASGGTMDGTLNVTGKYLSGGVDLLDIFTGGGGSDDIYVSTLVRASSANWNKGYDSYTKLSTLSSNWEDTFTTVQTNSADWSYRGTDLKTLSSNWQNTYTLTNSNSANWDNAYNTGTVYQSNSAAYATIDFTNSKFFPLTGGVITGETRINSNLTVFGNLTTTGTTTFANTVFSVTSSLSVIHVGSGPAVWVGNNGDGDIASFYDIDQGIEILHVGGINSSNPNVGIKTSTPNKTFTVVGEISSTSDITTSGKFYIQGDGGSDQWQSTYATVQSNSATNWSYQGTDLKALSGNWESTYTLTNNNSANWDNVYTNVSSNSANYILNGGNDVLSTLVIGTNTDQDLVFDTSGTSKMIIASGGNVGIGTSTPNERLTVSGNISASGIIYSNEQQVATLVSPERTTITGNGLLSTFSINGADNISNPSALIVAIDGVLQEPQIDYTVTSGEITFTSPVPNGSKGVIISPSNTVQIANITPSDGSVTSEKLASDIEVNGNLTAPNQTKNLADVVINQRLFALMQSNIYNFNPQMFQFATALSGATASSSGHSLNLQGNSTTAFGGLAMAVLPTHNNNVGHASIFEVDDTVANAGRGGANPAYSQLDFRKRIIFQFEITTNFKHVSNNHNFFARLGGGSNAVNTSINDALPDSTLPIGDCYVALLIEQGDIKLVTNQYLEYPIVLPNRIISQSFGSLGNFTNRCVKFSIEVYQGVASLYKSGVLIGSLSGCPTHTSHFSRGIAFGCNSLAVTTVVGSGYAVGNIKLIVLNN